MQYFIPRKPRWLILSAFLSVMLLSLIFSQGIALASIASPTAPERKHVTPNVTCSTNDNQSVYADYSSFIGNVLFRVGYEDTPHNRGYGYCHVLAGHPDALQVIAYVLDYGQVYASSPTSVTIRGVWPGNWKTYQIYIVTSNNGMQDGQMRGIVTAYSV